MPSVHKPLYYYDQIAEHYRAAIRSGDLAPGALMPSVRGIAETVEVSHRVAARAVALLRDEGWIVTRPGKTAVAADHPPIEEAPPGQSRPQTRPSARHLWGSNPGPAGAVEEA